MSCPIKQEQLDQLKLFIDVCSKNPRVLHLPQLAFFKKYIESIGGEVPAVPDDMSTPSPNVQQGGEEEPNKRGGKPPFEQESDQESDLEEDFLEGCVEPDVVDEAQQQMGDPTKEVNEEDMEKADEKRRAAVGEFSEGNFDKALELYTEAVELNPQSALLLAKRGQVYLKLTRPNACIRDCSRALELNPDSAAAYKFRGRAYRLIGQWEQAAKDLRQACNIDFDEQADEWLREVTPKAKKLEQRCLKQERRRLEREVQERLERARRAKEAYTKAAAEQAARDASSTGAPREPQSDSEGPGAAGFGDFYKLLQDPEIMAAFQDPEVAQAFQDISGNPANISKYQSNPKIMALIKKLSSKLSGSGFPGMGGMPGFGGFPNFGGAPGSFPGFPGGFPGAGAAPNKPPEDDNLD